MERKIIYFLLFATMVSLVVYSSTRDKAPQQDTAAPADRADDVFPHIKKEMWNLLKGEDSHSETLCRGSHCVDDFWRYREAICEWVGNPHTVRDGKPPFNDGAIYVYWRHGDHRIGLFLRAVSAHYRNEGREPFVSFEKRRWQEPPK